MKKQLIALACMLAASLALYAQGSSEFATDANDRKLSAPCLELPGPAYGLSISADGQRLIVLQTGTAKDGRQNSNGTMAMYERGYAQPLWQQPHRIVGGIAVGSTVLPIPEGFKTQLTKHGILIPNGNKYTMKSLDGQRTIWEEKLYPVVKYDSLDIIIGYKSVASDKLKGIRMSTGEKLWETKIAHNMNWGWDNKLLVSDSLLIVVANDIYLLNPQTGTLRTIKARTGYEEVGKSLFMGLAMGIAGGLVGAMVGTMPYYYTPFIGNNIMANTCSKVYAEGGYYYASDRNKLRCFDAEGNTKWSYEFPSRTVGHANITANGDTLFMVNYAFGLEGGNMMKKCGRPFIASFNKNDGKLLFLNYLSTKKDMVEGAYIGSKSAFLMFDDGLAYQHMQDSVVNIQPWNVEAEGRLTWLPSDTVYAFRKNDALLTPLYSSDNHCVVATSKGKMLVVDSQLKITDDYEAANHYDKVLSWGNLRVVRAILNPDEGIDDFWLIDKEGAPKAHFTVPISSLKVVGHTLYILSENKVLQVDLRQFA